MIELARCAYIQRRENVIALGNSGTGKTHVALGLGLAACQRGMAVSFTAAGLALIVAAWYQWRVGRYAAQGRAGFGGAGRRHAVHLAGRGDHHAPGGGQGVLSGAAGHRNHAGHGPRREALHLEVRRRGLDFEAARQQGRCHNHEERLTADALSHSQVEPTATWPPRRMREAPAGATEAGWSGVIGAGDRTAGSSREGAAEPVFIGDDTLGADPPVNRNDGRVPSATAQGVEEVVEPGLDANFDMGKVGGNALNEANGEVALLADGVRDVEEELPAGHWIDGHDSRGLGVSR